MTVKELMRRLASLPPDTIVFAWSDGNESHAYEVTEVDMYKNKPEDGILLSD